MSTDLLAEFEQALKGRACQVGRGENDWTFSFGDGRQIATCSPWRILNEKGIAHAGEDDGQQFGLPGPVDGEARSNLLLKGRKILGVTVNRVTADLGLQFDGGIRIDVFNNSAGYEGWLAEFPLEDQTVTLIGMGGGDVRFTAFPAGSRPKVMTSRGLPRWRRA